MKILIPKERNEELEAILKSELPGMEIIFSDDEDEIRKHLDCDIIIPERYKVDKELLDIAKNLKLIHCGTGYNNVDLDAAKEHGVYVATTPGIAAQSVAEHVFGYIHEFYKQTSLLNKSMKEGEWKNFGTLTELSGKTLGLIGYGSIAKKVAQIGDAYGMEILVNRKKEENEVKLVDIDRLLKVSNIISVHCPSSKETKDLISWEEFDLMRKDSYLINTARGDVVNEEALVAALETGKIAGAGIDVYSEEPLDCNSPLRKAPNIILTPHTAYYTKEALNRRYLAYADNIKRLSEGNGIKDVV